MNVTIGATLTGGTSTVLTLTGLAAGKSHFTAPGSTRLVPKTVEFTASPTVTGKNQPVMARSGMKISFANRIDAAAGCCTVKDGAVIIDLGFRWSLDQPATLVDDVFAYLRGIVYTPEFVTLLKNGASPTA